MRYVTLWFLVLLTIIGPTADPVRAETLTPQRGYELVAQLVAGDPKPAKAAAKALIEAGDESLVPGIVDGLFFVPGPKRGPVIKVLEKLTGAEAGSRYLDWVEYVGGREDLTPKPGYDQWKSLQLRRVDARFGSLIYGGVHSRIRLEEIVWGGVPLDGIPSVDNPPTVPASKASFMRDSELVFGVNVNGSARAYQKRVLSWHEMLNDTVGGQPLALSYCTLCGSAILYSTLTADGHRMLGTSGLLYRSNKLMFDRKTFGLWSNITGEAVLGKEAIAGDNLDQLPVTLVRWKEWKETYPETDVLDIPAYRKQLGREFSFDYTVGAADRARKGVSFPVWRKSSVLDRNEEIYALKVGDATKAYRLDALYSRPVLNDEIGEVRIVLISDEKSGAIRAYLRADQTYSEGPTPAEVRDAEGRIWNVTEESLEPSFDATHRGFRRVPGHIAFWFGWFGFYPETEVWGASASGASTSR